MTPFLQIPFQDTVDNNTRFIMTVLMFGLVGFGLAMDAGDQWQWGQELWQGQDGQEWQQQQPLPQLPEQYQVWNQQQPWNHPLIQGQPWQQGQQWHQEPVHQQHLQQQRQHDPDQEEYQPNHEGYQQYAQPQHHTWQQLWDWNPDPVAFQPQAWQQPQQGMNNQAQQGMNQPQQFLMQQPPQHPVWPQAQIWMQPLPQQPLHQLFILMPQQFVPMPFFHQAQQFVMHAPQQLQGFLGHQPQEQLQPQEQPRPAPAVNGLAPSTSSQRIDLFSYDPMTIEVCTMSNDMCVILQNINRNYTVFELKKSFLQAFILKFPEKNKPSTSFFDLVYNVAKLTPKQEVLGNFFPEKEVTSSNRDDEAGIVSNANGEEVDSTGAESSTTGKESSSSEKRIDFHLRVVFSFSCPAFLDEVIAKKDFSSIRSEGYDLFMELIRFIFRHEEFRLGRASSSLVEPPLVESSAHAAALPPSTTRTKISFREFLLETENSRNDRGIVSSGKEWTYLNPDDFNNQDMGGEDGAEDNWIDPEIVRWRNGNLTIEKYKRLRKRFWAMTQNTKWNGGDDEKSDWHVLNEELGIYVINVTFGMLRVAFNSIFTSMTSEHSVSGGSLELLKSMIDEHSTPEFNPPQFDWLSNPNALQRKRIIEDELGGWWKRELQRIIDQFIPWGPDSDGEEKDARHEAGLPPGHHDGFKIKNIIHTGETRGFLKLMRNVLGPQKIPKIIRHNRDGSPVRRIEILSRLAASSPDIDAQAQELQNAKDIAEGILFRFLEAIAMLRKWEDKTNMFYFRIINFAQFKRKREYEELFKEYRERASALGDYSERRSAFEDLDLILEEHHALSKKQRSQTTLNNEIDKWRQKHLGINKDVEKIWNREVNIEEVTEAMDKYVLRRKEMQKGITRMDKVWRGRENAKARDMFEGMKFES